MLLKVSFLVAAAVAFLFQPRAQADEQVRRVQEELRKRNLYFSDVDGRRSPELAGALRRYQTRKGFAATGEIDEETCSSLNLPVTYASSKTLGATTTAWPDVPVLRSDAARALPEPQRVALETAAADPPSPTPAPPPAEEPPATQNLDPQRVRQFIESYLRAGETADIAAQVNFYAGRVNYFDHGEVDRSFIEKDTRNYCKRWTERKYLLLGAPSFAAGSDEDETLVRFEIAFSVHNKSHSVMGKTSNIVTLKAAGDDLKIVAIREERIRD